MKKLLLILMVCVVSFSAHAQYVKMVVDAAEGELSTSPNYISKVGDKLVYKGNHNFYSYWKYSSFTRSLSYVTYNDNEVFLSDGTAENTTVLEMNPATTDYTDYYGDPYTAHSSAGFSYPYTLNDKLYFKATTDKGTGTYVIDPANNYDTAFVASWYFYYPQNIDNKIYNLNYYDITVFDGTTIDTLAFPNEDIKAKSIYTKLGDKFILQAAPSSGNRYDVEIYAFDPSADTITLLANCDTTSGKASYPKDFQVIGDTLYFTARIYNETVSAYEEYVWATNGTPEGTSPVHDLNAMLPDSSGLKIVYAQDNKLFISHKSGYYYDLRVFDTETRVLTSIGEYGTTPSDFVEYNGMLYYSHGYYNLCRTDGSSYSEVLDSMATSVSGITLLNDKLYFSAKITGTYVTEEGELTSAGAELCVYDLNTASHVSSVAMLKSLDVENATLTYIEDAYYYGLTRKEGFNSYFTQYEVIYPSSATSPGNVTYTPAAGATVEVIQTATSIGDTAVYTVTAEDGVTTTTYTIVFRYASNDVSLANLTIADTTIAGFNATKTY